MTPVIMLCALDNQVADRHATAVRAVAWALDALPTMRERDPGTFTQERDDGLGYVETSIDQDGTRTIRIRPDASSTDDDVLLVEEPRRNEDEPAGLGAWLKRWSRTFAATSANAVDHMPLQRMQASVIAAIVDATAYGGGRNYVIQPPSLHTGTTVMTAGSSGPSVIPEENALCAAADAHLGHIAWLSVRRTSGCERWEFLPPSQHVFRLPSGGPDAVAALRAHAEMRKGLPFTR